MAECIMVLANQSDSLSERLSQTLCAIYCWIVKFDGVWVGMESYNEEVLGEEKL